MRYIYILYYVCIYIYTYISFSLYVCICIYIYSPTCFTLCGCLSASTVRLSLTVAVAKPNYQATQKRSALRVGRVGENKTAQLPQLGAKPT